MFADEMVKGRVLRRAVGL